jgi:WD40 repeat protein
MHEAGTYKCVKTVRVDSGKIISMAASNTPASPIVLVATTAKTIHAIDFYTGRKILDIETKHDRPVHTIIANYGGIYTPRAATTLDLALTGAFDETFRLWDLRSTQCERTFAIGSRTIRVGCCFSPDSKFVALGTERLGFEVWDIGQGKCLAKLKDDLRGVTVTWLDWNPVNGKIHCGTENGLVKIFV